MKDMLMKKLMQAEAMPKQEKSGKLAALKELIKQMDEIMSSDMDSPMEDSSMPEMQKVSIMAPDKEGLKQGLEKAEDILEGEMPEMEESEDMEEESYADKMNPLKDEEEETEEEE